jgi:hypothetical protein
VLLISVRAIVGLWVLPSRAVLTFSNNSFGDMVPYLKE